MTSPALDATAERVEARPTAPSSRQGWWVWGLALLLAVAAGLLSTFTPVAAAALALLPFLLLSRELPLYWCLIAALVARTFFDGVYNRTVDGLPLSASLGVIIALIGVALALRGGRVALGCAAVVAVLAISNLAAVERLGSSVQPEVLRSASILAAVVITAQAYRGSVQTLFRCAQLVSLTSALFSLYQYVTQTGMLNEGVMRPAGTLAHPNSAALLYAIAALVSVARYLNSRSAADLGLLTVFSLSCVATASMGGMITLAIMLIAYALFVRALTFRMRVVLLLTTALVGLAFVLSPTGRERLSELTGLNLSAGQNSRNSVEWRVYHWEQVLQYWRTAPLFGQGYGATTSGLLMQGAIPHNEYVRFLVETGIVGLVALLVGAAAVLGWSWRHSAMQQDHRLFGLVFALTVGVLVNAGGANTLLYSVPMYLYAVLLGGAIAFRRSVDPRLQDGPTEARPADARPLSPSPPRQGAAEGALDGARRTRGTAPS